VPFDRFASKSRFLDGPLPGAGSDTADRWIERWPGSSNPGGAGITLFAWGGAINAVAPGATAFVHRGAAFLMDSETARDSPRVVSASPGWLDGLYHALAPFGTLQAYQNFIDPALPDWKTAYYGANLPRLTAVKRRFDPDDAFRFAQSVPGACRASGRPDPSDQPAAGERLSRARATGARPARSRLSRVRCAWSA
jgi:hypothetical protein